MTNSLHNLYLGNPVLIDRRCDIQYRELPTVIRSAFSILGLGFSVAYVTVQLSTANAHSDFVHSDFVHSDFKEHR
ncbi:MAG: hypothetical protein ACR2FS_11380 [Phormidesmis sp.]